MGCGKELSLKGDKHCAGLGNTINDVCNRDANLIMSMSVVRCAIDRIDNPYWSGVEGCCE